jgi:hypothetical protein
MIIITNDFTDMMPGHHNLVESATKSEDPPLNVYRSKEDQGRQLEALTGGVHDVHHQKFTLPNHEITSPVNFTSKSIVMGEQNHGVEAIMFDEAYKGDGSKLDNEADNDNVSSKSTTEVTVMMYNTTTLKPAHSLKATVEVEDNNEEPPEEHDAKTTNTTMADIIENNIDVKTDKKTLVEKTVETTQNAKSKLASNTWAIKIKIPDKFEDMKEDMKKIAPLDALFPKIPVSSDVEDQRTTANQEPAGRKPRTPPITRREQPRESLPSCPRIDVKKVAKVLAEVGDDCFKEAHGTEDAHHEVDN